MRNIDQTLDEALRAEERELLRRIGDEPAFVNQTLSLFSGRNGWVNVILMVVQGVAFAGGAWAAWNFFQAADALSALRWGLPSAVLLLMSLTIKMAMQPEIQANLLRRELKRIELLIVRRTAD